MSSLLQWKPCSTACQCPNHCLPAHTQDELPVSPDFTHLSLTNDAPQPAEETDLRNVIASAEDQIQAVKDAVARLRTFRSESVAQIVNIDNQIVALEADLSRLADVVERAKAPLSVVRRLPSEILSHIFEETTEFPIATTPRFHDNQLEEVPGGLTNAGWSFQPRESTLWSIELVCKQWRREVLASPRLWTHVNVVINDRNFAQGNNRYLTRLGLQLARGAQHPLSLCIADQHGASQFTSLPVHLAPLLMGHASRIRTLELYLRPSMISELHLLKLWALEKLVLLNSRFESPQGPAISIFLELSNLRSVTVIDYERPDRALSLPWTKLTKFVTNSLIRPVIGNHSTHRSPSVGRQLSILYRMGNLEEWSIRCHIPTPGSIRRFQTTPIICVRLQSLRLSSSLPNSSKTAIQQVLDCFDAPLLSRMYINCAAKKDDVRDDRTTFESLCKFFARSSCPLTVLHFHNGTITPSLLHILSSASSLVELCLTDIEEDVSEGTLPVMLAQLSNMERGHIIVPQLRTLHLSGSLAFPPNDLSTMVELRWMDDQVERVADIDLCWFTAPGMEAHLSDEQVAQVMVESRLDQYRANGMKLRTSIYAYARTV